MPPRRRRPIGSAAVRPLVAASGLAVTLACPESGREAAQGTTTGGSDVCPEGGCSAIAAIVVPTCEPLCTEAQAQDGNVLKWCVHPKPGITFPLDPAYAAPGATACCPATSSADPNAEACPPPVATAQVCAPLCSAAQNAGSGPKRCASPQPGSGVAAGKIDPTDGATCCPAAAATDPNAACP